MPRNNQNNRRKRRNGRRRQGPVGFSAPIYRDLSVPTSMAITLHGNYDISSGVTGTNGGFFNFKWTFFNDAATIAPLYKYFDIVACRIRVSVASTAAATDSFVSASMAFFPINYNIEGDVNVAPTQHNQVTELPGSVFCQYGAKNFGKWFNPQIKHSFSVADAFNTSSLRTAGTVIWYVDDAGVSERFATVDIDYNLRFYQREYSSVTSFSNVGTTREHFKLSHEVDDRDITIVTTKGGAVDFRR